MFDLKKCINSILSKTLYDNYEIIIVENNSKEKEVFNFYNEMSRYNNIKVIEWKGVFNYSLINNYATLQAKGNYLLFLNNDTEVITNDWINVMLANCERTEIGAAGVKLLYLDGSIQHAGVVVGQGGIAGHSFVRAKNADETYFNFANLQRNVSATTAACMMVKREVFEAVGGFEPKLAVAFNDVDLCLKIISTGKRITYLPGVELYHYESMTRGDDNTIEKQKRFNKEIQIMEQKWGVFIRQGDPAYNCNLGHNNCGYYII